MYRTLKLREQRELFSFFSLSLSDQRMTHYWITPLSFCPDASCNQQRLRGVQSGHSLCVVCVSSASKSSKWNKVLTNTEKTQRGAEQGEAFFRERERNENQVVSASSVVHIQSKSLVLRAKKKFIQAIKSTLWCLSVVVFVLCVVDVCLCVCVCDFKQAGINWGLLLAC